MLSNDDTDGEPGTPGSTDGGALANGRPASTPFDEGLRLLESGLRALRGASSGALSHRQRLEVLERLEAVSRTVPALGHELINQLGTADAHREFGSGSLRELLGSALRIAPGDASSRIRTAKQLGARSALTGETLEPELTDTARAQRAGKIGADHVKVIQNFDRHLPAAVDPATRAEAEAALAAHAEKLRPDELKVAADRMTSYLNPDGSLDDDRDRARKAYLHLGEQGTDKMTGGRFCLDPEARAYLEAVFAKLAKPGVCNPDDETPNVDGEPDDDAARRDTRSQGKRQHDALKAALRALLMSGDLGRHRGLPVTAIITMTLSDLENASGTAHSGGGSLIPIRDALRMARHAHHYLAIFDDETGRPLYLGRSKRLASADQQIVLHAGDRGCTYPGCSRAGYLAQVHHQKEWAHGGDTDIDDLTFACEVHHPLVGDGDEDWATSTTPRNHPCPGRTQWHPPRRIDPERRGRVNHFHHPGEYLLACDQDGAGAVDEVQENAPP